MAKRAFVLSLILSVFAILGCASGGVKETARESETGESVVKDENGSEKTLPESAEIAHQSAVQFLDAGNYDEAIRHLRTATNLKPDYLDAWRDLGNTLTKVKDFPGGIAAYEKALALSPDNNALISSIAYNYLYLEKWNKAEDYYTKLVDMDSLSYEGNVHLGFIARKKDDIDGAIFHYRQALKARPNDAATMGSLAGLYEKRGDNERKMEYLKMAIAAAPDDREFKMQLGAAYLRKKDYASALPIFQDLVKTFPNEPAYHQNLGLILWQIRDQKAGAPAELEKALQLKGDDPYILGILAVVYNELGQYEQAIAAVKRGLDTKQGQEPLLYYQWGVALSKLEQFDDAIAMFNKVVQSKDPQWSDAAQKQVDRQVVLKKRAETKKQQE